VRSAADNRVGGRNVALCLARRDEIVDEVPVLEALHLKNILSPEAVVGRDLLADAHIESHDGGWNKGCEADGCNTESQCRCSINRPAAMKAWGAEGKIVLNQTITGTGGSSRICCLNGSLCKKSFQAGCFLDRSTEKKKNPLQHHLDEFDKIEIGDPPIDFCKQCVAKHCEEICDICEKCAGHFMDEEPRRVFENDKERKWLKNMCVATNMLAHGVSKLSCHEDPRSQLPAAITGCNPNGDQPGSTCKGGELFFGRWHEDSMQRKRCCAVERKSSARGA